jgi:glycosyltransferase involved in cell wall biosynthesis
MINKYKEIIWLGSYPTHYWRKLFCGVEKKRKSKICFAYFSNYNKNIKYEVGKIPINSIFLNSLFKILTFFYLINSNPPKLLIIQGYEIFPKFLIILMCRLKKIPFCFWGDTNFYIIKQQNYFFKKIKKLILRNLLLSVEQILYIGKKNKEFYNWLFGKNINKKKYFFLPYPTYVNNRFIKKKNNKKNKKFKIIYVGRLVKEKSLNSLLNAILKLKEKTLKKIEIKIFGNGDQESILKNFVYINNLGKIVKFYTSVKSVNVYKCFTKANLFILPSTKEPWGLVINESIYYGVPVLCSSSVGAAKDLIVNNKNGYLMKTNSPIEISKFIEKIIYNSHFNNASNKFFGKNYLEKKKYSFEHTKNQLVKLVDNYCEK